MVPPRGVVRRLGRGLAKEMNGRVVIEILVEQKLEVRLSVHTISARELDARTNIPPGRLDIKP